MPDDNNPGCLLTVQILGHVVHEPLVHGAAGVEGKVVRDNDRVQKATGTSREATLQLTFQGAM